MTFFNNMLQGKKAQKDVIYFKWIIYHKRHILCFSFSSVAQLCLTVCDPMDGSAPGLPVHHQLLEFTQTHVHWVGDAIQPFSSCLQSFPLTMFNMWQIKSNWVHWKTAEKVWTWCFHDFTSFSFLLFYVSYTHLFTSWRACLWLSCVCL